MEDFSICFCALHKFIEATEVFVFPLFDKEEGKKAKFEEGSSGMSDHQHHTKVRKIIPLTVCYISPRHPFNFSLVDSNLCVIASHVFPQYVPLDPECKHVAGRNMFHCDLKQTDLGWKQGPLLCGSRLWIGPYPIAVDRMLFVIGGNDSPLEPIIEVFCPLSQKWRGLTPPPLPYWHEDIKGYPTLSAVVDNPKRIILTANGAKYFYVYDVIGDFWNLLPIPVSKCRPFICGRAAVAGQTLYWFDYQECKFIAFHLEENKWIRGRLQGLKTENDFDLTPDCQSLIHVHGDLFVLLWTAAIIDVLDVPPRNSDLDTDDSDNDKRQFNQIKKYSDSHKTRTYIHCAKVHVSKIPHVKGKYGLKAVLESCQRYEVDHDITLSDAFLMENKEKRSA